MPKIVYIIPGFHENANGKRYSKIVRLFNDQGIKTIPVNITWKRKVMTDYVKQFLSIYQPDPKSEVYLFGFSFGATIALLAAPEMKPKLLILCSLSPYFKEDLPHIKKSWKKIVGEKRVADLTSYSFAAIAKKIKCRTILVIGNAEAATVQRRVKEAHKKIKHSRLIISAGAKHNIAQKEYLATLEKIIKKI